MQRARLTLTVVLLGAALVACGDDTPACAAPSPTPFDALRMPGTGATYRPPAYKPPPISRPGKQDTYKPPAARATTRPTSWSQYQPPHTWGRPYRPGRPVAPQPTVTVWNGHDYRVYPGYPGSYPVGVWPPGYGDKFGCHPIQEGNPDHE